MACLGLLWAMGLTAARAAPAGDSHPDPRSESPVESRPESIVAAGEDPWSSPDIVAPRMDARPLARGRATGNLNATNSASGRTQNSWVRTTVALGGVVALIILLGWGYRVVAGQGGRLNLVLRGKHAGLIEVVARAVLSPRQSLCLVRIGPRLVLLGLTPDAVRTLDVIQDADLTAQLMGQVAQRETGSSTVEFTRCLEREAQTYDAPAAAAREPMSDALRLVGVKQRLAETIRRLRATAVSA